MQFYIVTSEIDLEMVTSVTNANLIYCISRSGAELLHTAVTKIEFSREHDSKR